MKHIGFKFWLIAILAAVVVFISLGDIPLLDPDEPVYGQTAKEMISSGDYISPRIYGEYWYDKPPMYYWLVALSYKMFGVSEFSSRFPSAALAIAGALAVYIFARELFSARAGFVSALVLITSLEYVYLGKAAVTDMTLCFCLTASLLSFLTKRYYFFYIFAALATLTKGPVGILFPMIIIGLYLLITRQFSILRQMKLLSGPLLFAAIALPWYLIMYDIHGQAFIETFLGFHNVTRFTAPEHMRGAIWYFFIPVLIIGFFPWIAVLPQAVLASVTKSSYHHTDSLIFLNIWAAFIFLFFTFSQTKLISYILPMYPALAMLAGWYIDYRWNDSRHNCFSWGAMLFVLAGLLTAGIWYGVQKMPELIVGAMSLSAIITVMVIVCLFFVWKRQVGSVFWTQVGATVIFIVILMNMMLPVVAPKFTTKYLVEEFWKNYDGQSPVNIIKFLRPGFVFYADIYGNELVRKQSLSEVVKERGGGYYILRQGDYRELSEDVKKTLTIIARVEGNLILRKD